MIYASGLPVGRLYDKGHFRLSLLSASTIFVVCLFVTAECSTYWQLLLCQGVGIGVSRPSMKRRMEVSELIRFT